MFPQAGTPSALDKLWLRLPASLKRVSSVSWTRKIHDSGLSKSQLSTRWCYAYSVTAPKHKTPCLYGCPLIFYHMVVVSCQIYKKFTMRAKIQLYTSHYKIKECIYIPSSSTSKCWWSRLFSGTCYWDDVCFLGLAIGTILSQVQIEQHLK